MVVRDRINIATRGVIAMVCAVGSGSSSSSRGCVGCVGCQARRPLSGCPWLVLLIIVLFALKRHYQ